MEILEKIVDGLISLAFIGVMLLAGIFVFAISALIAGVIFNSLVAGVIVGLVVTFGIAIVLFLVGNII